MFDQPFSSMTESELATAFLNNNVAFVLPSQYRPPTFGPPEADMIGLGTRVQRLSKLKSALWVRFLSPPSYKDKKLQLYPRSMEPHKGPGQGKDFSLLSALAIQYPSALTLRDIGITERTRAATTAHPLRIHCAQQKSTFLILRFRLLPILTGLCPPCWVIRNGMMMY
jgi:hypothetical protein